MTILLLLLLLYNTYLLGLVDVFFKRQSTFLTLYIPTMLLFSTTCSFIRMKQTSVHAQLLQEKKKLLPVNFTFRYIDDVLSLNVSKFRCYFICIFVQIGQKGHILYEYKTNSDRHNML
jgi:hypothetical protein